MSHNESKCTIYIFLSSFSCHHMLHPIVSITCVSSLSLLLFRPGMLHCGLCLPKGGPHGPANMFLVRASKLCLHQNAYCCHKTPGTERKTISFKLRHSKNRSYLH